VAASKNYRRGKLEGLLLQLRYDFRHRTRDIELVRPAGNSDDIEKTPVVTRTSSFGPLIALDRRRDAKKRLNPLLPDRGFRIEVRGAYGEDFLLGTARFIKLGMSGQHFIPLGSRFRISNGIRYDHGIPLGGDVALPEVERFFAGGDTTVRGFEQDRLAIEVVEEELSPYGGVTQFRVIPAGGNIRLIHNLDLQMRVWENSAIFGFPIASAIFLDTGIVTNSWRGFEVRDLRHSLGIALARLIAPFGSFSIEYAIPLDPELGDNPRGRAHVNFGFLF
jgi:outer membrane protein insertion porin family